MHCQACGAEMIKPKEVSVPRWKKRQYCSIQCRAVGQRKHGEAWKTSEYFIWQAMIRRCVNPSDPSWHKYGGRGITLCARWRHSYEAFLSDMGRRPSSRHSLDRIDNNKGYSPENCRWADILVQANNTRSNRVLEHNGRSQTIAEWSREIGIRQNSLVCRLRRGWSVEKTLTTPLNENYAHMRRHP